MTVSITSKIVYTIHDTDYPSESHDCIGIEGLDKHFDECLGAIVDIVDSESWNGNMTKSKLKMFDSMVRNLDRIKTVIMLKECIDELKREVYDDE